MRELDKVLDENEKVFWEGNPNFWPFFLSGVVVSLFGIVFLVVGAVFLIQGISKGNWLFLFFPQGISILKNVSPVAVFESPRNSVHI